MKYREMRFAAESRARSVYICIYRVAHLGILSLQHRVSQSKCPRGYYVHISKSETLVSEKWVGQNTFDRNTATRFSLCRMVGAVNPDERLMVHRGSMRDEKEKGNKKNIYIAVEEKARQQ